MYPYIIRNLRYVITCIFIKHDIIHFIRIYKQLHIFRYINIEKKEILIHLNVKIFSNILYYYPPRILNGRSNHSQMLLLACTGSTILTARSSSFSFFLLIIVSLFFSFFSSPLNSDSLLFHLFYSELPHPCRASLAVIPEVRIRKETEIGLTHPQTTLSHISISYLRRYVNFTGKLARLPPPQHNHQHHRRPACPGQSKFPKRQGVIDKKLHNLMILHVGIKSNLQN